MSGRYRIQISQNYDEQLNKTILLLKSQKLNGRKETQVNVCNKRLNNDGIIVNGRKLDQDKYKPRTKLFGQGTATACVKEDIIKIKSSAVEVPKKTSDKEKPSNYQDLLKNFCFNFPQEKKVNNVFTLPSKLAKINQITPEKPEVEAKSDIKESKDRIDPKKHSAQDLPKYQLDHMYFVLDTNVLIDCLYYLEDVANLMLLGTSGSILYVPYRVIKELDSLKCKQATSFAARRAIEYLNDKFDDEDKIEAQSALEDAKLLVGIDSPDDSIINCCLQLKDQLNHMMLLTNDNNLRLKARASAIRVSTCYQLSSYKSNWWSLPRDRCQQRRHRLKA